MKSRDEKTESKPVDLSSKLSVIMLNVNDLNTQIKRQKLAEWVKNHDPNICSLQDIHCTYNDLGRLKVNRSEKTYI